jgi:D-glycero-D-manno-heptose 1,7-bisphosphate phosphatase
MKQRAIFIDKDGTLVRDVPYNVDPDLIVLEDGVREALTRLKRAGYLLIVVSNQSGIARGFFTSDSLHAVRKRLDDLLQDTKLDDFYFCPHHPQGEIGAYSIECDCRKPKAGMLFNAARDYDIDLSASWMIGDILNDVEAGKRAGCKTILIDNGNETQWIINRDRKPDFVVTNWSAIADTILGKSYAYA